MSEEVCGHVSCVQAHVSRTCRSYRKSEWLWIALGDGLNPHWQEIVFSPGLKDSLCSLFFRKKITCLPNYRFQGKQTFFLLSLHAQNHSLKWSIFKSFWLLYQDSSALTFMFVEIMFWGGILYRILYNRTLNKEYSSMWCIWHQSLNTMHYRS